MSEVRGDSYIQIEKSGIKTVILEGDYEKNGYKKNGWAVIQSDWTKERTVKPLIDAAQHQALAAMNQGTHKKK